MNKGFNNMLKKALLLSTLLVSGLANADENKVSAGIGFQYGGAVGMKYAMNTGESSRVFASIGLVGAAIGYEYALSEQNAISFAVGSEQIASEKGFVMLEYNHYFQGRSNAGWRLGGGIGIVRQDEGSWWGDYGKTDTTGVLSFNLGYQF
jgi:hypothetical protein